MASFGAAIPSYAAYADGVAFRDLIQAAEDLGYADVWFADHVVMPDYAVRVSGASWLEPLACCFVGLGATRSIRFGTDVLVAPYRNPVLVAKMVATADRLSGGRLTLGLGVGYIRGEFEALSAPDYDARGAVTDEYIDAMRALWGSEGACTFGGEYVRFEAVHFAPPPLQRPVPIWVGGNRRRAHERAARRGNGWHPLFPTPEDYAEGRKRIVELRGGAEGFVFSYSCPLTRIVAGDERLPGDQGYEAMQDVPAEYGYAPPVPHAPDGRARFTGNAEQVLADVNAYVRAGAEHFTLRLWTTEDAFGPDRFIEQLRRFAEAVVPRVDSAQ